jgi:hypothetical protein
VRFTDAALSGPIYPFCMRGPTGAVNHHWTHRLASQTSAARMARSWVRDSLAEMDTAGRGSLPRSVVSDATLCISELVNASLIARSTTMLLALQCDEHSLRLSLEDDGVTPDTEHNPFAHAQQLAMLIVEATAQCMGIEPRHDGRELWAWLSIDTLA